MALIKINSHNRTKSSCFVAVKWASLVQASPALTFLRVLQESLSLLFFSRRWMQRRCCISWSTRSTFGARRETPRSTLSVRPWVDGVEIVLDEGTPSPMKVDTSSRRQTYWGFCNDRVWKSIRFSLVYR